MNNKKKYLQLITRFILITGFIISCKDDDSHFIVPITHNFKATYGKDYNQKPVEKAQIVLTNNEDGKTYKKVTDEKGMASMEIIPGVYKVNISRTLTPEEYEALTSQKTEQKITFNGIVENLKINENTKAETVIEMVTGRIGNLIFKQIYYSGSDPKLGASKRDQFFEVHNNSNQTIYLDGIYWGRIKGVEHNTSSCTSKPFTLPDKCFYDWSQSIGQKDPQKANTDYVYLWEALQFPGNGKDYPLASGKSAIVAATALNHKQPLTVTLPPGDFRGRSTGGVIKYEVPKPELTIDLSRAPFEAYYRPYQEALHAAGVADAKFEPSDIDNPNSANMKIVFKTHKNYDLQLNMFGYEAEILFECSKEDFKWYNLVPLPSIKETHASGAYKTAYYKQLPKKCIIDGVELQRTDGGYEKTKWLPSDIDAGETGTKSGRFSGQSVIRKISSDSIKVKDGKKFYQDTNNSTNDFYSLDKPQVIIE